MATRIKESERQIMLMNYLNDKTVPEGFYVKTMADGRIQFRRIKPTLTKEEETKRKIEMYEKKIQELKKTLNVEVEEK